MVSLARAVSTLQAMDLLKRGGDHRENYWEGEVFVDQVGLVTRGEPVLATCSVWTQQSVAIGHPLLRSECLQAEAVTVSSAS